MTKQAILKFSGSALVRVLLAVVIGTLLLALAYTIPQKYIDPKVESASHIIKEEGVYPSVTKFATSAIDNWTDSIMLLEAAFPNGDSPFKDAMQVYRYDYGNFRPDEALAYYYESGGKYEWITAYPQYWHGYLVLLKPLLAIADYSVIRIINGIVQTFITFFVCVLLWRKKLRQYIIPYILCIALLMPTAIAKCMQYSSCFYIMSLGCIAMLLIGDGRDSPRKRLLVFLYIGVGTAYFDFLTYPIAAFGLPALFCVNVSEIQKPRDTIRQFFAALITWAFGYGAMWLGKFAIGSIITGEDLFAEAMTHVSFWMGDDHTFSIPYVFYHNLRDFACTPVMAAALLLAVVLLALIIKRRRQFSGDRAGPALGVLLPYCIAAALPFAWYVFMLDPSGVHFGLFGNKSLVVTAFAGLSGLTRVYALIKEPAAGGKAA